MFNRIRLFTSGFLFFFSIYCIIWNPQLPFSLPTWVYIAATVYFAAFPVKDMLPQFSRNRYKGRQFGYGYEGKPDCTDTALLQTKRKYDRRALAALVFWLCFMASAGSLYLTGVIGREWIFFFFALSNFGVYFSIFFWCPFYSLFLHPECCMECRIYNWDSFFSYSFLIYLPSVCTVLLFSLGVLSLLVWESMHHRHPERFYKVSSAGLACELCDHEACKQNKKKFFSKELKEEEK